MGSRNVIRSVSKATTRSLLGCRCLASCTTGPVSSTIESKDRMLRPILKQSGLTSRFSTSRRSWNDKKSGYFLFGRPPEPNLEAGKQSIEERVKSLDPLSQEILEKLHGASGPTDILNIYDENKRFMTDIHTSRALQQLSQVWELNTENLSLQVSHQTALQTAKPIFRELCASCLRDAQHMDDHTFMSSLRSLLRIGVPENSVLVQTLLTQSQHRLNQMSAASLAVFCQILSSLKVNSELSQALKKASVLIVPKMVVKADNVWQCVTFLLTTGNDIPIRDRFRLQHKLTALLKLDPSVTPQDCCQVVQALSRLYPQSPETVEAVYELLRERWGTLPDTEVCRLVKDLGKLRYQDPDLMRQLSDHISRSFEELDSKAQSGLFDGLANGRFVHHELANLGCRYILESASDRDLTVDIYLVASTARYFSRLNLKPDQLTDFSELCHSVCEEFFSGNVTDAPVQVKIDALDAFYHACLLDDLGVPGARPRFEARAKEYLQAGNLWTLNVQRILLQMATLRRMDGIFDWDDDQVTQQPLPNPWLITQRQDHAMETKMVLEFLHDSVAFGSWDVNVDLGGGLVADFVIPSCGSHSKSTKKGLVVNILPEEGQAANLEGHLVGLYHLKDRALKKLGYQTLWIEANRLSVAQSEGKKPRSGAISYLRERLQQNNTE